MAIESDDFRKIRRDLAYLEEDIKVMPQYLKGPFRLVHDCIDELAKANTKGANGVERDEA